MKIEIKHRYTSEILFSHEQENNTIAITLQLAIKTGANLIGANLSGTNLSGANLRHCIGNMSIIFSMQLSTWTIVFTKDILAIGCQQHTIEEWKQFTDEKINSMDSSALAWWKEWKDFIFLAIEKSIKE